MTYAEKLKDPRWQKKRLEILNRDSWTCQYCKDEKTSLHVHHKKYTGNPWDAPSDNLISVCADCHIVIEYIKQQPEGALSLEKIIKRSPNENEKRIFCIVNNAKNNKRELVIVAIVEEKIVDGIWLNYKTIDEIIYEFI